MVKRSTKSGVDKAKKPTKAKTAKAPPPPEKPPTTHAEINRIGDIIQYARKSSYALMGWLIIVLFTLSSVTDYSLVTGSTLVKVSRLGVSIPIYASLWAGALLVTAVYTYLHLYLEQLWEALGDADAQYEGKRLADVIHPWLVSDAALRVRDKKRKAKDNEHCSRQRGMSSIGTIVSILLVWFFGLYTIGLIWWRSMPAHDIWLTGWLGILFAWSLYVFWRSSSYALAKLGGNRSRFPSLILLVACISVIGALTILRTHYDIWEGYPRIDRDDFAYECTENQKDIQNRKICGYILNLTQELLRPARAEMAETVFTQKPVSWKGYDLEKQEYHLRWCNQIAEKVCEINPLDKNPQFDEKVEEKFEEAWINQLVSTLATFSKPDLRGKRLEGADLRSAQLEGVRLENARLQGAILSEANMQGAYLFGAEMQGAELFGAEMQGAYLSEANMQGAYLSEANMQGADFSGANMQGADFSRANMQGAYLSGANMQGADFSRANMQGAYLSGANMQGAYLSGANMQGAYLSEANMQGTPEEILELQSTNLREANFSASSLRFVDFTGADVADLRNFDKSFGDGSVKLAEGMVWPEKWCKQILSDSQYWGRYYGWLLEHEVEFFHTIEFEKYPLIPFGTPCPE